MTIEELQQRAELLTGKPKAIEFTDRVVAVVAIATVRSSM